MNWETAKQKVAEKHGYSTFNKYAVESRFTIVECCKQAAELYQQSNLDRIKELEHCLNTIITHSSGVNMDEYILDSAMKKAKELLK